jgi:hypothetical protein
MAMMVLVNGRHDKELSDEINASRSNAPTDPFEAFELELNSLFEEAENYLDGQPIENQEQADDISRILSRLRKATKDADEFRKAEKRPHDEAAKAVQLKWMTPIDRAKLAEDTAKNALAAFLRKQEEAQRAAVEAAKQEVARQASAAAQAAEQARPDDLAGQTTARVLKQNAIAAEKEADKLANTRVQVRGGERAVSLRSVWTPALTDACAALRHYRERQPDELKAWLLEQAAKDVRAGARSIPGFDVTESKVAV